MDQILLFLISSLALTLMPGPDILFVINQSLENKKSGFLVSLGLCSGLIIHTLILAFGVSSFIEQNYFFLEFFKYFGALYLFYLAFLEFKKNLPVKTVIEIKTKIKPIFFALLII